MALLQAGILIRCLFLPLIGFEQDFHFFASWATHLAENSVITIYDKPEELSVGFINYPPFYLYILSGLARAYRWFFTGPLETRVFLCMIKSVTVLFEILTAFLLYRFLLRRTDERTALYGFGFYFLNPAIFYVSVYYGQVDAIFSAFLLLTTISLVDEKYFWGGFWAACSLLMKIQSIPFMPLFFFWPIVRGQYKKIIPFVSGFAIASFVILTPFLFSGRLEKVYHYSVEASVEWGKYLSVGAFNLWYLHADPYTLDKRIWGWLFGADGIVTAYPFIHYLTYRNLGVGLFGIAFLGMLTAVWKRPDREGLLKAAAFIALAFYMLPTKVHERYLFPFFVFYAPLALTCLTRRFLFIGFSASYLLNLIVICPLIGKVHYVEEIDSTLGAAAAAWNVVLFTAFIVYEYVIPFRSQEKSFPLLAKTIGLSIACVSIVLYLRADARTDDPYTLYLSRITPISCIQDWPPIPPELSDPPPDYQLRMDLSTDENQLRIGDHLYRYGIGAHANSRIEYDIPRYYTIFETWVGVDYETMENFKLYPDRATVSFEVWVNGVKLAETPLMIPTSPPRKISVRLPRSQETNRLTLIVRNGEDGSASDHADWALAKVLRTFLPPAER